jgi:hypothetical protein
MLMGVCCADAPHVDGGADGGADALHADALHVYVMCRDASYRTGKALCSKLKELIPRQMFRVPIQVLARALGVTGSHARAGEGVQRVFRACAA